ncbi:ABC transporter ATP-binding protein [Microbacterium sp. Marseille-Q6965]|uniref:ABC transporter ATP-binding protein n=1 Tax=Microbacterium sp. Marseille-Q6965 TaxID=2965072 RepID=UPI0021B821C0|nr:ABC transporter ATP-binding protein [Microbacterium sp. Marseille-Q6965]
MTQPQRRTASAEPLLRIEDLEVTVHKQHGSVSLVRETSFEVREGEIVCLVGESGSGKSVTARTIMGLTGLDPNMEVTGRILLGNEDLVALAPDRVRRLRGRDLTMVFQEPLSSLDPVYTVEFQLREALRRRERVGRKAERERLLSALREVGIHDGQRVLHSYPHQLSGGMCQRVMIAMALLGRPRLLIADEPTTALDVTVQAQILDLIDRLRREEGMAVLLVTHDMGVAADLADRVIVMYAGQVVEDAAPRDIFARPAHPYTAALLGSIPPMAGERPARLPAIRGSVPDPSALPTGCAFHPRCPRATETCVSTRPVAGEIDGRRAACWHPLVEEGVAR